MLRLFSRRGGGTVQQIQHLSRRFKVTEIEDDQPIKYEKCINQVNLLGRVGRDAEIRGSEAHPVCVFSIATNHVFTKADGNVNARVDWHRISVFKPGLREKVAANLKKGTLVPASEADLIVYRNKDPIVLSTKTFKDRVFVNGVLRYDEFTDSNDNLVRATTIIANDLVNLTKRHLADEEEADVQRRGF